MNGTSRIASSVLVLLCGLLFVSSAAASEVTLVVVDQHGTQIPESRIAVGGLGTYATGSTVDIPDGTTSFGVLPGRGTYTGDLGLLMRVESVVVTSSTASISFEWITQTVDFRLVDQDDDPIPLSYLAVSGSVLRTAIPAGGALRVTLPITDESVYPTLAGTYKDGYTVGMYPGLGTYAQNGKLVRTRTVEFTATTPSSIDLEWVTHTVDFRLVDQDEDPIPLSKLAVSGASSWTAIPANGALRFTLPITDESVYPTLWGDYKDGYRVNMAPGLGSYAQTTHLVRNRWMEFTSTTASVIDLEWVTRAIDFRLVDQDEDPIPLSKLAVSGASSWTAVPASGALRFTLPITDESVYPTLWGDYKDGYRVNMAPGLGSYAQTTRLVRNKWIEFTSTTASVIDLEWVTRAIDFRLVDQDEDPIPLSKLAVSGASSWTAIPASGALRFTLPITDESVYPTLWGAYKDGYRVNMYPGLGTYAQSTRLVRSKWIEFTTTTASPIELEWVTRTVDFRLLDQSGAPIPKSQLSVSAAIDRISIPPSGAARFTLPITDESAYPTLTGEYRDGYRIIMYPGIGGAQQSSNLRRNQQVEFTSSTASTIDLEWSVNSYPVRVVDESGSEVAGSSFIFWGVTYYNGDTLNLPLTDNTLYPTVWGTYANGHWILVRPGDTSSSASYQFETLPLGVFVPQFFAVGAGTYGLRSQLNEPPTVDAGGNVAITSSQQSSTVLSDAQATDLNADDDLTYRWFEGETALIAWTDVTSTGGCPLDLGDLSAIPSGEHTLTLKVSDGTVTVSDAMILQVANSAPIVAGPLEIVAALGESFDLEATVADFDGDDLTWTWREGSVTLGTGTTETEAGGAAVALPATTVTGGLSLGGHVVLLEVSDGHNPIVSREVRVNVTDDEAPTIAPSVSPSILWPPNHKLVTVTIETNAEDNSNDTVTVSVVEIQSTEDPDKDGDGNTIPDWVLGSINQETGVITLQLRSERSGKGPGRVYTVTVRATDSSNNASTVRIEVRAPHDKRKK